ncbi:hypothetical protein FSP39_021951 [Pinctada imbricata]|uniref:Transient receptor potential cation channel subfamily A member 1 n=1 Tax=Pinctada imbricata TaxID=66713 RepID=A0AA88XSU6_PINIB|nr:hypothetical protein FSP39_021951 [Pinctada imbricata]
MEIKPYHISPLHVSAKYNASDVCRLLINSGANVISRDCKKKTPLHYAARRGHTDIATMLLQLGKCDVNVRDEDQLTSLHDAIMHKHSNIVPLLLKSGADIFTEDVNGTTAFHFAASEGMVDTMNLLLRHASNTDYIAKITMTECQDKEGNTPLHCAVQNNKLEDFHFSPLHIAAVNGSLEIVDFLLLHGAISDTRDKDFMTPLHRAALHNRCKIIESLIKRGSDLNAKNKYQMTPLMAACCKGNQAAVKLLLTYGAQIAESDTKGRTALHIAVEAGSNQVVEILMEHNGAELFRTQDSSDKTAMHYAAMKGNTEVVDTLIHHSCPLDSRDEDGRTPLHIAAEFGQEDVIDILMHASQSELHDEDSDGRSPLMVAAVQGHYFAVHTLLKHGADVSSRDENSCTALMLAAKEGHAKVINLLLQNYAEIDVTDKLKNTALHIASSNGQMDSLDILLKKGANVNIKNSYGKTALDMAIDNKQSDIAMKMLEQDNWEDLMNTRDNQGKTPMIRLIEHVPDAAKKVMDKCISTSKHRKDDKDYTVTYDFKYIDPGPNDPMCKKKRIHLVENMVELKRSDLLSHSLVQNMLIMKWTKFGRKHFYFNLACYFIYLSSLTAYIGNMPLITTSLLDDVRQCPIELNETERNNHTAVEFYKQAGIYSKKLIEDDFVMSLKYFIFLIVVLYSIEQFIMIFTSVMFLLVMNVMSWSTAFSIVLPNTPGFRRESSDAYPITVVAMMLGELNYITNFVMSDTSPFLIDNYFLILSFMITIPLALMNLLIGIAVGDIEKIQKQAYIKRLGIQLYNFFHGADDNFITEEKEDTTKMTVDEIREDVKKTKHQISVLMSSQKQTHELVRQLCEQMNLNTKLDTLSVVDSMRTGMASRAGGYLGRRDSKFD